jgi:hypothetical protein
MPLYQVSTAPGAPGRGADFLTSEIEKSTTCWALGGSVWLVSTGESADELGARLARVAAGVRFVVRLITGTRERPVVPGLWDWLNCHP